MIVQRIFAWSLVPLVGLTLGGCASKSETDAAAKTPSPLAAPVPAPEPAPLPKTHVVVVREPAPEPVAAPDVIMVQMDLVEFLLPAERAAEFVGEVPSFETLQAEAKAGKIGVTYVSLPMKDAVTASLKQVVRVRYPESHSGPNFPEAPAGEDAPAVPPAPGAAVPPKAAAAVDVANAKPAASPAGVAMKPFFTPQDFTEREIGLVVESTPVASPDRKTVTLDLKARRDVMDAAVGETTDASGCPNPPRFTLLYELDSRVVVPVGKAVLLSALSPATMSKDQRMRVIFVHATLR